MYLNLEHYGELGKTMDSVVKRKTTGINAPDYVEFSKCPSKTETKFMYKSRILKLHQAKIRQMNLKYVLLIIATKS